MIARAIGMLRSRIASARSKAPPPPKPPANMNMIEIDQYNKLGSTISQDRWWLFTWLVMVPLCVLQSINCYYIEKEHNEHGPPPYIPYDHINNKAKAYPWGDGEKSLFHHPKWNAIPGKGYEWEVKEDEDEE